MIEACAALREQAEASINDNTIVLDVDAPDWETLQLKAAMAVGALLIDRKATKIVIRSPRYSSSQLEALGDALLQAARIKFTKTEYISCPGCGRTLYNLQETIAKIKAATKDCVGLKISWAVSSMGLVRWPMPTMVMSVPDAVRSPSTVPRSVSRRISPRRRPSRNSSNLSVTIGNRCPSACHCGGRRRPSYWYPVAGSAR